jgi:hypothetical protein
LLIAVPLSYGVCVTINVIHNGLLPPKGKKREIAVFFFRIVVVFVVMWLPSTVAFFVIGQVNVWVVYFASIWAHSQGAASTGVSLFKSDIWLAVANFMLCHTCRKNRTFDDLQISPCMRTGSRCRHGGSSNLDSTSLSPNILMDQLHETNEKDEGDEQIVQEAIYHVKEGQVKNTRDKTELSHENSHDEFSMDPGDKILSLLETSEHIPTLLVSSEGPESINCPKNGNDWSESVISTRLDWSRVTY